MAKFDVGVAVRVWISKETTAASREAAEARVLNQAEKLLMSGGFEWLNGEVELVSCHNISLLNKIPI